MSQKNKSKLTHEEDLLKTHVINLEDVKATVEYEKKTSKKPAIIIASFGIFAILFGTSFPLINSLMSNKKPVENVAKKIEKKKVLNNESNLNCTYTTLNNSDGTDTSLNIQLTFSNNKLIRIFKNYTINPTMGNNLGTTSITNYLNGYQPFLQQTIKGYQMTVNYINNSLIITSSADLKNFNPETFPELHKNNVATNIDYIYNTEKTIIYNDLITKGFSCK